MEKNASIGVLHQMQGTLKVTEVKHVRINTQFFYKFHFGDSPKYIYLINHDFVMVSKKSLPKRTFIVLYFTFRSIIHFVLIFLYVASYDEQCI